MAQGFNPGAIEAGQQRYSRKDHESNDLWMSETIQVFPPSFLPVWHLLNCPSATGAGHSVEPHGCGWLTQALQSLARFLGMFL